MDLSAEKLAKGGNRKGKELKKRKQKDLDHKEDENGAFGSRISLIMLTSKLFLANSLSLLLLIYCCLHNFQSDADSCSDVLSAIQNICTCFGIGGLNNAKKRYVTHVEPSLAKMDFVGYFDINNWPFNDCSGLGKSLVS